MAVDLLFWGCRFLAYDFVILSSSSSNIAVPFPEILPTILLRSCRSQYQPSTNVGFALFNFKYFMSKKWEIFWIIWILVGAFSNVTFDIIGIDISGGFFLVNMTINAYAHTKIKTKFRNPVFILYGISWIFVLLYYTVSKPLYVCWYLCYCLFIIMRIESLKIENAITPVVT